MHSSPSLFLSVFLLLTSSVAARQSCTPQWLYGPGRGPGEGPAGTVFALGAWDPDGAGPLPEQVVLGGDFLIVGPIQPNGIVRWTGSTWIPFGSGIVGEVNTIKAHNGQLFAGGVFQSAGGVSANNIARWTGSAWQPLGSGVNARVHALEVFNGFLVAAGEFTTAGGAPALKAARWDGAAWQSMTTSGFSISIITCPHAYQGQLYAGNGSSGGWVSVWVPPSTWTSVGA